jgi:hypothetical protein
LRFNVRAQAAGTAESDFIAAQHKIAKSHRAAAEEESGIYSLAIH